MNIHLLYLLCRWQPLWLADSPFSWVLLCAHVCVYERERDLETSKQGILVPSWAVAPREGNMPTGLYFVLKYFCFTVTILPSQENIHLWHTWFSLLHDVIIKFDCILILTVSKFKQHCLQFYLWTVWPAVKSMLNMPTLFTNVTKHSSHHF